MLAYIIGVVLFALGICVSIALHEYGHMATAKKFGMKVRRYFVGFGPTVFSFHRGETEYGLKAIPLGGFCDIAGMTNLDEVKPEEAPRAMWRYPVWKRTVVLSAGSAMHFVIGFLVLYLMATTTGLPNIDRNAEVESTAPCVQDVELVDDPDGDGPEEQAQPCTAADPAPAVTAGMQPGDVITAVAGEPVANIDEAVVLVREQEGPTALTVLRGEHTEQLTVDVAVRERPNLDQEAVEQGAPATVPAGVIGIEFVALYDYGVGQAVPASVLFSGEMFQRTWHALLRVPERIPPVVESIFGAERPDDTPVSVVGASRIGGEAVELGLWSLFLFLLAALNFFVGIFNLLPLLPLDGGHIAVTCYERVRDALRRLRGRGPGGPADYSKLNMITAAVIVLGGSVVLLIIIADIVNPVRIS